MLESTPATAGKMGRKPAPTNTSPSEDPCTVYLGLAIDLNLVEPIVLTCHNTSYTRAKAGSRIGDMGGRLT